LVGLVDGGVSIPNSDGSLVRAKIVEQKSECLTVSLDFGEWQRRGIDAWNVQSHESCKTIR